MDDEINNVLPCVCERCRRGQIFTCEQHLVQRDGGEIGPAHLLGHNKLDEGIEIRSQQSSTAGRVKEYPELVNIFCIKLRHDLGIGLPALGLFPENNAHEARMLEQVIKQRSNHGIEKGLEFMGVGGNGFVFKQGDQDMRPELSEVPIDALVHCDIEAELIVKVLKEQAFVVARRFRDGIDPRPIEPVLREDLFRCIPDSLACALRVMWAPPSTSRFIHADSSLLFLLTDWITNYLVRL